MEIGRFRSPYPQCSRRHFLVAAGGAAAGSLLAGCSGAGSIAPSTPGVVGIGSAASTLVDPAAKSSQLPIPIPANPVLGGLHFQKPFTPGQGDEATTVYDFNGLIGRAVVQGSGTGNGTTLYYMSDFGFAKGEFRAADGSFGHGTFGFIWFDLFSNASRSTQIHDYSPDNGGTPGHASGLFWTVALSKGSVRQSGDSVTMQFANLPLLDAFRLFSSPVVPATLSVTATFTGTGGRTHLDETSQGSTFVFKGSSATVELQFTASSQVSLADATPFTFESSGPTTTTFGRLGRERNGFFANG